jgi:peptidyl-prolyl cis-trans isomerase C
MPKRLSSHVSRAHLLALFLAPLLAACAGRGQEPSAASVARVGGREIPARVYEMYLKNGRAELGLDERTEEGRRRLELLREGIVAELIERELIRQEAERRGLRPEPARVAEEERRAVAQLGGEEKFGAYLAEHRLSREEYMETVRLPLYGELMRRELTKDLKLSDEEVKAFYESHRGDAEFQAPERVTASHVLVAARPNLIAQQLRAERGLSGEALERATREEVARRRARAEDVRRRALAPGADFAALAREFSDDQGTRERGGALGQFARGSHPRAFDDAAFALRAGEVGPVVETDFGFHVIKVAARELARALTLAEASDAIRRRLLAAREAETLQNWLREARRTARVRVREPFRFGKLREEYPAS